MFFFDYGQLCLGHDVSGQQMRHRYAFMILDKNHKPEPRPPAI